MKVNITCKNFNASDHLKDTIEKKFAKLSKYFSSEIVANVTLIEEKNRKVAEATISAKGTIFRAEESTNDMYAAIDAIVDKLSAQMSKYKTKLVRKHKDHKEFMFDNLPEYSQMEEEEKAIVKTKKFDVIPMTTEEAIMQMELLGHSFFVFLNLETDSINVLYKRKDNNYGVLEPKY